MKFSITFDTNQSSNEINFILELDGTKIDTWPAQHGRKTIAFEVDDTDEIVSRVLLLKMSGKKDYHTELNEDGDIVKDYYTIIENITFDEIDVTDLYCNGQVCYAHYNGIEDKFYGFIGVNGTVNINFYTPLWKWFLSKCK